ncbi:hypothetical protein OROHE_011018 [Orobanche hederae]
MYCNLTKGQAFPMAIRVSSKSTKSFTPLYTSKTQPFTLDSNPKLVSSSVFIKKTTHQKIRLFGVENSSVSLCGESLSNGVKSRCFSSGFYVKCGVRNFRVVKGRGFSSFYSGQVVDESDGGGRLEKSLPWLVRRNDKEEKRSVKSDATKMRSSWEESAEKFLKSGNSTATDEGNNQRFERRNDNRERTSVEDNQRFDRRNDNRERKTSMGDRNSQRFDRRNVNSDRRTVMGDRNNQRFDRGNAYSDRRTATGDRYNQRFDRGNDNRDLEKIYDDDEEEEDADIEEGDNPRWYKLQSRSDQTAEERPRFNERPQSPQSRSWSKQESWGKNTLKEASEPRAPKLVGEGVYGVGPVLAALSAGRREFYALFTQEGLDLSGNNRKKDKKGFEKVLRIADKLGLSRNETSKHDLNMFADNRPHQGLLLDASPLEMVNIQKLDRVSSDMEVAPVWVALDEVTDPQNLGAIIRSAYFFGVSGVVLCAKNSAPLSGVVSKASAGALELTELRSCKNMMQFLVSSAENGWRVLGGSVSSKSVPLNEIGTREPTILVLGSEGTGLRPLVERSCTELIRIPGNIPVSVCAEYEDVETAEIDQRGSGEEFRSFMAVESLNVSVAAGVLLHHLVGSNNNNASQLQTGELTQTI